MNKRKTIASIIALLIIILLAVFLSGNLNLFLAGKEPTLNILKILAFAITDKRVFAMAGLITLIGIMLIVAILTTQVQSFKNKTKEILPGVSTPLPDGNGECGTAHWSSEKDIKKAFNRAVINKSDEAIKFLLEEGKNDDSKRHLQTDYEYLPSGGMVVGMDRTIKDPNKEVYYYNAEDTHSLIVGATRSGKTRCDILQSICVQALAGESMINSDPKGEQYLYCYPFLQRLGYMVYPIDFLNPEKSARYNYLQAIIDYVNDGDIARAIDATWDIVAALVGEAKGERIWHDGECSTIACAILCVVYDNRDKPEYQNLTNVYHFLGKMCKTVNKKMPIEEYLNQMPDTHPAKSLIDIANVAPSRTKGSFFTSALATLRLFTNPYIYEMTRCSDFSLADIGRDKSAVFIILPDEKDTYYSVATLFCNLAYVALVGEARKNGNRLLRRVNFNLDEVGNFTKLNNISKMETVGGGYGIRLNMALQDFEQFDAIYGKEVASTLRSNCQTWLYLLSNNSETRKDFSEKLGNYTIKSPSVSAQSSSSGVSVSSSYNYTSRALLTTDEIGELKRPYQLLISGTVKSVMYAPDISQTIFNGFLGLGDKDYNQELLARRQAKRPSLEINFEDMQLWGIWNEWIEKCKADESNLPSPMPTKNMKLNNKSKGQ